jgi:hypothetical protein
VVAVSLPIARACANALRQFSIAEPAFGTEYSLGEAMYSCCKSSSTKVGVRETVE